MFEPKEPTVPLALYENLLARYDALVHRMAQMKLAGAVEPRSNTPKPVIPPAPDEAELALEATRIEWVKNLTQSMTAQGVDASSARAWAEAEVTKLAAGLVPG